MATNLHKSGMQQALHHSLLEANHIRLVVRRLIANSGKTNDVCVLLSWEHGLSGRILNVAFFHESHLPWAVHLHEQAVELKQAVRDGLRIAEDGQGVYVESGSVERMTIQMARRQLGVDGVIVSPALAKRRAQNSCGKNSGDPQQHAPAEKRPRHQSVAEKTPRLRPQDPQPDETPRDTFEGVVDVDSDEEATKQCSRSARCSKAAGHRGACNAKLGTKTPAEAAPSRGSMSSPKPLARQPTPYHRARPLVSDPSTTTGTARGDQFANLLTDCVKNACVLANGLVDAIPEDQERMLSQSGEVQELLSQAHELCMRYGFKPIADGSLKKPKKQSQR